MQLNPYLSFNGNCEQAITFYQKALGAEIGEIHRYRGSPMADQCPPEWLDKVMHTSIMVGANALMASDGMPGCGEGGGFNGVTMSISTADPAEAERLFNNLAQNARAITMPLEKTFWALKFGMLIDQFGVPWMVNCEGGHE